MSCFRRDVVIRWLQTEHRRPGGHGATASIRGSCRGCSRHAPRMLGCCWLAASCWCAGASVEGGAVGYLTAASRADPRRLQRVRGRAPGVSGSPPKQANMRTGIITLFQGLG